MCLSLQIDKHLKPYALTGLQENYRGYNETDLFSLTLNVAMVTVSFIKLVYKGHKQCTDSYGKREIMKIKKETKS